MKGEQLGMLGRGNAAPAGGYLISHDAGVTWSVISSGDLTRTLGRWHPYPGEARLRVDSGGVVCLSRSGGVEWYVKRVPTAAEAADYQRQVALF